MSFLAQYKLYRFDIPILTSRQKISFSLERVTSRPISSENLAKRWGYENNNDLLKWINIFGPFIFGDQSYYSYFSKRISFHKGCSKSFDLIFNNEQSINRFENEQQVKSDFVGFVALFIMESQASINCNSYKRKYTYPK